MESILTSVKKQLNIDEFDESYDVDVVTHINTVFVILNGMGVGPTDIFTIEDKTTNWVDFTKGDKKLEQVKTYMYLKVRMVFDPPASSSIIEVMNKAINELEWRLSNPYREEEIQNG